MFIYLRGYFDTNRFFAKNCCSYFLATIGKTGHTGFISFAAVKGVPPKCTSERSWNFTLQKVRPNHLFIYLLFPSIQIFFFNGPILASFCLFFVFCTCYNSNIILWKHRRCGWDSNPGGKMEGADDSTELRRHTDWLYQSSYDWLCPDKCNFA